MRPVVLALTSCLLLIGAARANARGDWNVTISGTGEANDCNDIRVHSSEYQVVRGEEQATIAKDSVKTVHVTSSKNGGILTRGWDRNDYFIRACKAAAASDEPAARQLLGQISFSVSNGEVSARGPEGGRWLVYLIVQAPRGAALNLESTNGPISMRSVAGTVQVQSTNGPLSLHNCSGEIHAEVRNGPIDLLGSEGKLNLHARNGPITVALAGSSWENGDLDAHAENGPVLVKLPPNYRSGVLVESAGHAPVSCRAKECEQARKDWDNDSRRLSFGSSAPVVKVSTVNGPVSVESRLAEY
jgi:hypothetical protein